MIDEIRADLKADGVRAAITNRDTAAVFDWLISALSYQGISDQVAYGYMERHGRATWHAIDRKLGQGAGCPKLKTYWHFHGCRYNKLRRACAELNHISRCPLPTHDLRNGRLNQTAYSLYLFVRDIADGDLVGWIDQRLHAANELAGPDRLARMRDALIAPLREIYGVSDKVLTMALSCVLLGAPKNLRLWREVGGSMIAIDTLVHNFLHRTGILHRFGEFVGENPELVAKAAELMDLKVYKATTPDLAAVAKKLPVGRLYANGRGFVPNVRQALYMDLVDELGDVPQAALSTKDDNASTPVARGLPRTWDEIAPGHLVIAQEAAGYGWWEAIVIGRTDDMFTLRYRDYPKLPKFSRHRSAIGLMSPPSDQT